VPGSLIHHVIGNVLGTPEMRLEIPEPKAASLSVLKSHHHFRIIDRYACAISIANSGIRIVVANEAELCRTAQDRIRCDWIIND
jgi:hypothetical protein